MNQNFNVVQPDIPKNRHVKILDTKKVLIWIAIGKNIIMNSLFVLNDIFMTMGTILTHIYQKGKLRDDYLFKNVSVLDRFTYNLTDS